MSCKCQDLGSCSKEEFTFRNIPFYPPTIKGEGWAGEATHCCGRVHIVEPFKDSSGNIIRGKVKR